MKLNSISEFNYIELIYIKYVNNNYSQIKLR